MMRTQQLLCALLFFLAAAFAIVPASAWTIQKWSGPENGATLAPGTAVSTSFDLSFDSWSSGKFDAKHSLTLYSELTNPKWTVTKTVVENEDTPVITSLAAKQGIQVNLAGFIVSDQASSYSINVQLSGTVPALNESQEVTLLRIQEKDADAEMVKGSEVKKTVNVVVPTTEQTVAPAPVITLEETEIVITPEPTTAAPAMAAVITPSKKHTYSPGPEPLAICGALAGFLIVLGLSRRRA